MSPQDETDIIDARHAHANLREVEVINLKTNDVARFAVPPHLKLERVWQMAYDELGETRGDNDILETRSGQVLTAHLEQTIEHIAEHIDPTLVFQIHGEQGGA